jgi:hypothetical protein
MAPPVKPDAANATPPTTVNPPAPDAAAPPARRAIPAPADQAKSRKSLKEVFAADLVKRAPAARRELARKLLAQGKTTSDAPADQFVLLVSAVEAGKLGSDLPFCCRAADVLAQAYDVDALRFKSDAATTMTLRADSPAHTDDNCMAGLRLADQLIDAEEYPSAARLLYALRKAPPRPVFLPQIQQRITQVDTLREAADRVAPARQKLKTAPDDAAANSAVGQYLCFDRDDWKQGLPLLAKGTKSATTEAAALDLAATGDSAKAIEVGDFWWTIGDNESGARQLSIRRRAAMWYSLAAEDGKATGLKRTLLEKRIASAPPAISKPRVISARWGGGSNWADVTDRVNDLLASGQQIAANNGSLGADPTPGWRKRLQITYMAYGVQKTMSVDEDQKVASEELGK